MHRPIDNAPQASWLSEATRRYEMSTAWWLAKVALQHRGGSGAGMTVHRLSVGRGSHRELWAPSAAGLVRGYHGTTMARTIFEVNLDRTSPAALHDQVAAQIRRAIAEGEAGPGERLPLAKDIAAVLGVNKNTVLRAMHVLRDEGLLEFRRGRGLTVAGTPQRGAVLTQVRNLLEFARQHGHERSEIIQMIRDLPQDA